MLGSFHESKRLIAIDGFVPIFGPKLKSLNIKYSPHIVPILMQVLTPDIVLVSVIFVVSFLYI